MDTHFRVAWKVRTRKNSVVRDYHAPSLSVLLQMLKRSENVDQDTVDELVIHQINDDGTVTEMFASCAVDTVPWKEDGKPDVDNAEAIVTSSLERISQAVLERRRALTAAKPRIRLVHKPEPEKHYAANGLYWAVAAT